MATYLDTQTVLTIEVFCFANYNTPSDPKPIRMQTWLTNAKYQAKVDTIRAEPDKATRDALKATLPAITPSGLFTYRQASSLVPDGHSRLIQFDIDLKDNPHIRNYASLKSQLCKLPFVAYCGLSVSGTGYWGLVPIAYPERHGQHFDALKRIFAHYHIKLDEKPRNVASLRGYSYDADGYFAEQVMLFELYDVPQPPSARQTDFSRFNSENDSELLTRIVRPVQASGEGDRHSTLLKAARLAGGYVATGCLDEQTVVYALETVASEWPMFAKSQKTIRDGIKYGLTAPIYPQEKTTYSGANQQTRSQPTYQAYDKNNGESNHFVEEVEQHTEQPIGDTVTVEITTQQVVTTIAEQKANPGSLLRPGEDQLERQPEQLCDHYPSIVDEPHAPDAVPVIRGIHVRDKKTFHQWQCENPYHKQLGLASLPPK